MFLSMIIYSHSVGSVVTEIRPPSPQARIYPSELDISLKVYSGIYLFSEQEHNEQMNKNTSKK